jgi:hypothetical protein
MGVFFVRYERKMEETNDGIKISAVTDCVFCEVRAESIGPVDRLKITTERDCTEFCGTAEELQG